MPIAMGKKSARKPGAKVVRTTIVIEEGLWERLRFQSTKERRAAQDIVADAVSGYLKKRKA
jgi:hypothetical protein